MATARNDPCRKFVCGWLEPGSPFPGHFRPHELGVMIITVRWRGEPAYILCSAGCDPDEALLAWMREFSLRTRRPFFYEQNGERFGFGSVEFQQEMVDKLERGERRLISRLRAGKSTPRRKNCPSSSSTPNGCSMRAKNGVN